jgi:sugar phosphate isomerase/epimerase
MRIAISNIAWDPAEDEAVARLLRGHALDAIDIAPGKYFPDPIAATEVQVFAVRDAWEARGVEITGMQALLFGTQGLNVFGDEGCQVRMLEHLEAVARIGRLLGATRLVFGSPRNRDRSGLDDAAALEVAGAFFRRLGSIASAQGVCFCLEPNPVAYGANFMTTSDETAAVVRAIDHPAIRMQLDTGALAMNGEDPAGVIAAHWSLFGHVHASEPKLVPLGDGDARHADVHAALAPRLPDAIVTIEMLATTQEPHLQSIDRALGVAVRCYRPELQVAP